MKTGLHNKINLLQCFFFIMHFLATNAFAVADLSTTYLKRSTKGLLLGDAFVARATDESALFYNPAILGRSDSVKIMPINIYGGANDFLNDADKFKNLSNDPAVVATKLMDYPIHLGFGTEPYLQLFNVAFSYIYNVDISALMNNQTHPVLDLNYRYDRGFIMGAGIPIYKSNGSKVSLGASAKYIRRAGLHDRYSLVGTRILNVIQNTSDTQKVLKKLGAGADSTWGFDVGLDYSAKSGMAEFGTGLSFLDIRTVFEQTGAQTIPEQPMSVNWGSTYKISNSFFQFQLSADLSPLNQNLPYRNIYHLGLEAGTPIVSFLGGYTYAGFSYGLSVNLFLMKIVGGYYHTSIGDPENSHSSRQAIIYLSLLDFSFDG